MKNYFISIILGILLIGISALSGAQGVIEKTRCPNAEKGNPDGVHGGSTDRFTHESWVEDAPDKGGCYFRRCIENQSKKNIWTHWKGILARGWIPEGHRLYASTFRSDGIKDPKDTDLWWGDNRDKQEAVEAKCYKGEQACKQYQAVVNTMIQKSRPGLEHPDTIFATYLERELKKSGEFIITTHTEFYVPRDASQPSKGLVKFALGLTSRLKRDSLYHFLSIYMSSNVKSYLVDLKSSDPAFKLIIHDPYLTEILPRSKSLLTAELLSLALRSPLQNLEIINFENRAVDFKALTLKSIDIDIADRSDRLITSVPVSVLGRASGTK